jgi:hypothetical protein
MKNKELQKKFKVNIELIGVVYSFGPKLKELNA